MQNWGNSKIRAPYQPADAFEIQACDASRVRGGGGPEGSIRTPDTSGNDVRCSLTSIIDKSLAALMLLNFSATQAD
jgi:hypothetical protein